MGWRGPAASLEPEKKANSCWCLTGGRGGWVGGASQGDTTMRRPYEIWAAISGGTVSGARRSRAGLSGCAVGGEAEPHGVHAYTPCL
jgi:hypothetical protein